MAAFKNIWVLLMALILISCSGVVKLVNLQNSSFQNVNFKITLPEKFIKNQGLKVKALENNTIQNIDGQIIGLGLNAPIPINVTPILNGNINNVALNLPVPIGLKRIIKIRGLDNGGPPQPIPGAELSAAFDVPAPATVQIDWQSTAIAGIYEKLLSINTINSKLALQKLDIVTAQAMADQVKLAAGHYGLVNGEKIAEQIAILNQNNLVGNIITPQDLNNVIYQIPHQDIEIYCKDRKAQDVDTVGLQIWATDPVSAIEATDATGKVTLKNVKLGIWKVKSNFSLGEQDGSAEVKADWSAIKTEPIINWWDKNWRYCKPFTVDNSAGGLLSNYQIATSLDTTGFVPAKMQLNGKDIRVVDTETWLETNYWIGEDSIPMSTATRIWAKVPTIAANSSKSINLYYGNPNGALLAQSDGPNTFDFFDDFNGGVLDGTKWDTGNFVSEKNGPLAWEANVGYNVPYVDGVGSLIFDGQRSATDAENEEGKWSGYWGRSVISKNSMVENNFTFESRMWFSQTPGGIPIPFPPPPLFDDLYGNDFDLFEVGVVLDKNNFMAATVYGYNFGVCLGNMLFGVSAWIGPAVHPYVDSTWEDIKFSFTNNGDSVYTVGSESLTYPVGRNYASRKVYIAFDHRNPASTVTQKADWFILRKYSTPEPAVTPLAEVHI